jgi:hypothetical protein
MMNRNACAFCGERQGDLASNVAGTSRHQGNAILELHVHGWRLPDYRGDLALDVDTVRPTISL